MPRHPSNDIVQPEVRLHQDEIAAFRQTVKRVREEDPLGWEATRKLVTQPRFHTTRMELAERINQASLGGPLREFLLRSLGTLEADQPSSIQAESLKQLTGFPITKGIRALCLYFQIGRDLSSNTYAPQPHEIAAFLASNPNPYDFLLQSPHHSILDLGAGDLSFEEELIDRYIPQLTGQDQSLVVHAIDRLQPGSQFGGIYHADRDRLRKFSEYSRNVLRFGFWGGVDMVEALTLQGLLPSYSIVTCHAPATPTFAFEPTRIAADIITSHLRLTKGSYRTIRLHGEEALEVHHRGKALTFPPWKFVIQGPLTLLELMARRSGLCVLSAIDTEVFWEILSQLVEKPEVRPLNIIFNTTADIFY